MARPRKKVQTSQEDIAGDLEVPGASMSLELPGRVSMDTPFKEQQQIEVEMANGLIEALYFSLTQSKTVSGINRTVDQIFSAIEKRRHLMLRQYGHKDKDTKGHTIDLLD